MGDLNGAPGNYAEPCVDCAVTTDVGSRVIRGGSFERGESDLPPPIRNRDDAPSGFDDDGLRIVS
jgi:hypothetical protein